MQRKNALILFTLILVIMAMSSDSIFIVSYGTMLFGIFTVGALSYDEFDNCLPFLLTLPVTRKEYVREKFLFCGGGVLFGWILSMLICTIFAAVHGNIAVVAESFAEEAVMFPIFFAIITVMIPIQMKYDVEKSRIVLLVLGGSVFALAMLGSRWFEGKDLPILHMISSLPDLAVVSILIGISVLVIVCMYGWSIRVMEEKVF